MDHDYSINFFYLQEVPKQFSIAFVAINTVISLMVIMLNSFLCHAIRKLKLLKTVSYRFILALAISDLCNGLLVQPLYTLEYANAFRGSQYVQEFQVIMQFLAYVVGQYSGFMVVVISIDRYLHMKHLNNFNVYMTSNRIKFLTFFGIAFSLAMGIVQTSSIFFGLYVQMRIFTLTANVILSFIGIFFYLRAFLATKKRVESLHLSSNISFPSANHIRRADLQFAKGVLIILISLSLCYFPYFLTGILLSFKIVQGKDRTGIGSTFYLVFYCTILFVFMVPLMNALVLCRFNRAVRKYFICLVLRRIVKME